MSKIVITLGLMFCFPLALIAQDSVDVTFRYTPPAPQSVVYLPGEFNNWGPTAWAMEPIGNNTFVRSVRLRIGGPLTGGGVAGAYQYKFYYAGLQTWPNDPLNHRFNPNDNNNSFLYVKDPTMYQLIPNQRTGIVRTGNPEISAYLFPKVGASVDTASIRLKVNEKTYVGLGSYYTTTAKQFLFRVPDRLSNGSHTIILSAAQNTDTVTITVQAGFVQLTNIGSFTTRNPQRTLYGVVEDSSIHSVKIVRNSRDTVQTPVASGTFNVTVQLAEGVNNFKAIVRDSTNALQVSDSVCYTYFVNHSPNADIDFVDSGASTILSAQGSSDPDSGQTQLLTFRWSADPTNPQQIPGIDGASEGQITASKPSVSGEYFFTLIATDPDGNKDTTRSFFTILDNGTLQTSTLATIPRWVKQGRVYEMFFKSMTPQGTINAALQYLPYFKSLGVNILWVMPIMQNAGPIDHGAGVGYNIIDFFKVAKDYGTNQDFKDFVRRAHELGLKVILDVTPNHTSYAHPFAQHAKLFRQSSPYWNFYQHKLLTQNTNGLGEYLADGFVHYDGWDQLLNYNWSDIDARTYMIEAYKWWIKEFDIDGYRFDVYWGPHRRANGGAGGENEMGGPVRQALKHIKPDIFLLAEDAGTGVGTEVIYGDHSGGVDAAYDWNLYGNGISNFYQYADSVGIGLLHQNIYNNNYYPGPNAMSMRFLENHDEERIAYQYGSYEKTMPIGTVVFTAPGLPMIYSGQEVGFGLGLNGYDQRRRGVIDWNAAGKAPLTRHYQRLALIREQFKAFSTQRMVRVATGNPAVYAFTRPFPAENGVVMVNVSSSTQDFTLYLDRTNMDTTACACQDHYGNDLYNDTTFIIPYVDGRLVLSYSLKPYGSAVFVVSDTIERLNAPLLVSVNNGGGGGTSVATTFRLDQNYPNPFNPTTTISYQLASESAVSLKVFNILGEEVATLVDGRQTSGYHVLQWNGRDRNGVLCSSGVYFLRLEAGGFAAAKRMLLLK